jgi:DNA (cytosine-5)-methyltransferase 1
MERKKYSIVSLFSGCGGLDLGFEMAKSSKSEFEIVWVNDKLRPPCETYSKNFGLEIYEYPDEFCETPKIFLGDIEKIDFEKALNGKKVDVVLGGPPCQDFSIIRGSGTINGKRKGTTFKRGRLFSHFARALAFLQPKVFVFENVKGLKSANKGNTYRFILDDFKELNLRYAQIKKIFEKSYENLKNTKKINQYNILFAGIVDFSKIGVPQKRERLIIIGLREDLVKLLSILGTSVEKLKEDIKIALTGSGKAISTFPLTPMEIFHGDSLSNLSNDQYKAIMQDYKEAVETIKSKRSEEYMKNVWPTLSFEIWSDYITFNKLDKFGNNMKKDIADTEHIRILEELGFYKNPLNGKFFDDNSNAILPENDHIKERMSNIPPGKNHEFVKGTEHEVVGLMSNIYKRIHPLQPSSTIIARGGGGTWGYHYKRYRQRLTNRERARLQTFPDNFKFEGKPGDVRRQIGEAVPPLASKTIAETILKVLDIAKS